MHGRKQRFATILLLLAFILVAVFRYISLSNVGNSGKTVRDRLAITAVHRNQTRTLSFGDDDPAHRLTKSQKLANWTPTFVTAASENHFGEVRGMVHSMQSTYPDARFVVYDLGLTREQRNEVRRWCNTRYVPFAFDRYPPHVKNLHNYAWKPLIIAEHLNELGTFFWLDARPRLKCDDLSIFPRAVLNGSVDPFLTFGHSERSIFATTHPGMFEYFPPVDVELLKDTEMKYATAIFVSDSSYTRVLLKR